MSLTIKYIATVWIDGVPFYFTFDEPKVLKYEIKPDGDTNVLRIFDHTNEQLFEDDDKSFSHTPMRELRPEYIKKHSRTLNPLPVMVASWLPRLGVLYPNDTTYNVITLNSATVPSYLSCQDEVVEIVKMYQPYVSLKFFSAHMCGIELRISIGRPTYVGVAKGCDYNQLLYSILVLLKIKN